MTLMVALMPMICQGYWLEAEVTAYCPCDECCGKSGRPTAYGTHPKEYITVAAPRNVPLGMWVLIEGVGWRKTEDRTAKRFDGRWDVFMKRHQDALEFGKRQTRVFVPSVRL